MTRSMQPTIQAVERITHPAGPSVTRLAYSYSRGYEDGLSHGAQAVYRRVGYCLAVIVACGFVAALVI